MKTTESGVSLWHQQGGTLSHGNACKEYGLTESQIIEAIRNGKLQYKQNYAHGNPYYRLLRHEVEALANELFGPKSVSERALEHELETIQKGIISLKRKLSSLEKKKSRLKLKLDSEKS